MIIIQENIQTLKTESKTASELLKEESIDIWEDLHFYNERLLTWGEPIKIDVSCNFLKPKTINSNHKCKEVKQFMDFLHQTGGHENDISIEEIKRHEEWYKKYINLQKRKKGAIKSWKKIKTARKTPMTSSNVAPKLLNAVQEPDETIQQKLMKWKVLANEEEKLKSVRELEFYEEQRKRKSEQLKRKQQEEIRKVVREWKEGKQIIEQQEIAQRRNVEKHEKKVRALEANRMIKQFQSQDDMYILKMRQQKKREIAPQVKRGSSCVVKRDPERLLKPTKQWINRVHDENYYANELSRVMDLKSLPKL
ncbi:hypothetical protein NQ318_014907 [Aromia moschata]|uniref:Coiled-coil domain-containing protein 112 n=1 Tax=Aromia moschata TaxID=1265417 RepID=A0AAV8YVV0_9CUCU|nr:hypothetical protein NQ318_014907 [Aromia moschata]